MTIQKETSDIVNVADETLRAEFKSIVNNQYKKFYQYACVQLADMDTAKDIVQETFLTAYEKLSSFQKKSSLETWIFGILNNKILMHYKDKQKSIIDTDLEKVLFKKNGQWKSEWFSNNDEDNLLIKFLKYCINALKTQSKQVLLLKYYLNKKTEEICTICNMSQDNVWQILHRSKLQLKICIQSKLSKDKENG